MEKDLNEDTLSWTAIATMQNKFPPDLPPTTFQVSEFSWFSGQLC